MDKKETSDEQTNKTPEDEQLIHDFQGSEKGGPVFTKTLVIVLVIAAFAGVGTGFALSKTNHGTISQTTGGVNTGSYASGIIVGSSDTSTFKDTAEGIMQKGGIAGEGQFHLVRPGGDSQSVYLTSSIVDLSQVIGKKVRVWGQTQKAQHAGWLMDVGRVEVLE